MVNDKTSRCSLLILVVLALSFSQTQVFAAAGEDRDLDLENGPAPVAPANPPQSVAQPTAPGVPPGAVAPAQPPTGAVPPPPAQIPPPPPGTPPPPVYAPPPLGSAPSAPPREVEPNSPYGGPPSYQPDQIPPPPSEPPPGYRRRKKRYYSSGPHTTNSLADFRVAAVGTYQTGTRLYSPMISWNPQFTFSGGQYYGFNVGGMMLSNVYSQNLFNLELQVAFGTHFGTAPLGIEGALGIQNWFNTYGGTYPVATGTLFYSFDSAFIDRIFMGYSAVLVDDFYTSQVKLGVGFSF
jgi:hypothetical protein